MHAEGLWTLAEALRTLGDVTVVVPDREQSGVGTAVDLRRPLRVQPLRFLPQGLKGFSVEGTPGDCVILGLEKLVEPPVALLVSGINEGANLGNDVLISGTVGAALQGYFLGVPSMAVSVSGRIDVHYDTAAEVAREMASEILSGQVPTPVFLNVNIPNLPLAEVKGIQITHLAPLNYRHKVEVGTDYKGHTVYQIAGIDERPTARGTDVWAIRHGYISVTPIQTDLLNRSQVDAIRRLRPRVLQRLGLTRPTRVAS